MKTEAIILAQTYTQARLFAERELGLDDTRVATPSFVAVCSESDFNRVRGIDSAIPVYVLTGPAPDSAERHEFLALATDYLRANGNPIHRRRL